MSWIYNFFFKFQKYRRRREDILFKKEGTFTRCRKVLENIWKLYNVAEEIRNNYERNLLTRINKLICYFLKYFLFRNILK